jgi:chromosome segregation ATPase
MASYTVSTAASKIIKLENRVDVLVQDNKDLQDELRELKAKNKNKELKSKNKYKELEVKVKNKELKSKNKYKELKVKNKNKELKSKNKYKEFKTEFKELEGEFFELKEENEELKSKYKQLEDEFDDYAHRTQRGERGLDYREFPDIQELKVENKELKEENKELKEENEELTAASSLMKFNVQILLDSMTILQRKYDELSQASQVSDSAYDSDSDSDSSTDTDYSPVITIDSDTDTDSCMGVIHGDSDDSDSEESVNGDSEESVNSDQVDTCLKECFQILSSHAKKGSEMKRKYEAAYRRATRSVSAPVE